MTSVRLKQDRRFSRKIIVHEINRRLPFLKPLINLARFLTFRDACPGYPDSQASYSDGSWLARKVTKDQRAIEGYLAQKDLRDKRLLHVGVGSSHLALECVKITGCVIDGLTVIPEEKAYANGLGLANYAVYLMNKYEPASLRKLPGGYAAIIDNDPASYACCKAHFEEMLKNYLALLAPGGEILAGEVGLGYFDSGFPPPGFYLKKLGRKLGFALAQTGGVVRITLLSPAPAHTAGPR